MNLKVSLVIRRIAFKTISAWQKLFNRRKINVSSAILCYHDISDRKWGWTVTKKNFNKQIESLLNKGEVVRLDDFLIKAGKSKKPFYTITFDDGYESVYKLALPILRRHNLTATVFIVGRGSKYLLEDEKLLNKRQLQRLKKEGWVIGYHTSTHPNLTKLSTKELKYELVKGKEKLEQKIGIEFDYISYPFGKHNETVIRILKKLKFKAAFTVDGSAYQVSDDKYQLPRVTIYRNLNSEDFKALLTNKGLKFNHIYTRILQLKDRFIK